MLFLDQSHLLTREGLGLLHIATISFASVGALYHSVRRYSSATARCAMIPDEILCAANGSIGERGRMGAR